ncbi:MAG: phosphopyruvate hydratase [Gemmataceae bacterium]|nr:phosphopyruvate hydratase [Gemmataceae bacterium]MCI0740740.1 phosphopyruvate hydratase [Gemmataceae bacterium]
MPQDAIARIHAREVLDSRGNPTVEVRVQCAGGCCGRAIVPSGASTGKHEACELRDGDPKRYAGKGVQKAVAHVKETIAPALIGMPASDQSEIDRLMVELDGTPNKSRLGANALLGVSLACAHAAAAAQKLPLWHYLAGNREPSLPLPMVNLISGGLHAGRNLEFQDFLFLPVAARTYSEALEQAVAVYRSLGEVLRNHGFEGTLVGDEGGFGPRLENNEQAVEMILRALECAGLTPGKDAALAVDVASTHFYENGRYVLRDRAFAADDLTEMFHEWAEKYPIASIEDGMAEDDWSGWKLLTEKLGRRVQLIGDDLFATNPKRLARGCIEKTANSILIKLNQIGTLTETLVVIDQARAAGYRPVISARSGETEDATIADLAVATAAGQIKIGSIARSERLAKYNQLLRIEEHVSAFSRWQPVG